MVRDILQVKSSLHWGIENFRLLNQAPIESLTHSWLTFSVNFSLLSHPLQYLLYSSRAQFFNKKIFFSLGIRIYVIYYYYFYSVEPP